jgi:hypothetical protein
MDLLFKHFSANTHALIEYLVDQDIEIVLTGGAVRDYLIYKKIPKDLDFEIRPKGDFSNGSASFFMKQLHLEILQKGFAAKLLPFFIISIESENEEVIDLSLPRMENYKEGVSFYNHNSFDVELKVGLDFKEASRRRDFSINAIGLKWDGRESVIVFDPFGGIEHIKEKKLVPCGENFKKDPVRFLRSIRFQIKLGFDFSSDLEIQLSAMHLEGLTSYYFLSEAFKSGYFFRFNNLFWELVEKFQVPVNTKLRCLEFLTNIEENCVNKKVASRDELLFEMINSSSIERSFFKHFLEWLQVKAGDFLALKDLCSLLQNISITILSDLRICIEKNPIDECLKTSNFKDIEGIYQLYKKQQTFLPRIRIDYPILVTIEDQLGFKETLLGRSVFDQYRSQHKVIKSGVRFYFHLKTLFAKESDKKS